MKQDISISIKLSKIDKTAFYEGKNGEKYLSIMLKLKGEKDQYGYDGFIVQEISKERKAAGEKGPILGNAKIMDWNKPSEHQQAKANGYAKPDAWDKDDNDSIPF